MEDDQLSDIYIASNARSLLSSLAAAILNRRPAEIIYLSDYSPIEEHTFIALKDKFKNIKFSVRSDCGEINALTNFPSFFPSILKRNFFLGAYYLPTSFDKVDVPWLNSKYRDGYIFLSGMFIPKLLKSRCDKITLREEGTANYQSLKFGFFKGLLRATFGKNPIYHFMGEESWIDRIEVSHPEVLPKRIQKKAKTFKLKSLLDAVPDDDKKKIFYAFCEDFHIEKESKSAIVVMQPLDVTKHCTAEEKNNLYQKIKHILESRGYSVFFKSHPRDIHDNITKEQLPKNLPIEIWHWKFNWKFDLAVAIYSSALDEASQNFSQKKINLVSQDSFSKGLIFGWEDNLKNYLSNN